MTDTGNGSQRKGRGQPCAVGKTQSLDLACDQPCHHRITGSYRTFHHDRRRSRQQRAARIDKHRSPLTQRNHHQSDATIQKVTSRLLKSDFIGERLARELLQFVHIGFDDARTSQHAFPQGITAGVERYLPAISFELGDDRGIGRGGDPWRKGP